MRSIFGTVSAVALTTSTTAFAGGVDRSGQSVAVIFQEGSYVELSFGAVSPNVSGSAVPGLGGFPSGNMASNFTQYGGAYKRDINETLSFALIYDRPFGAGVDYPTGTGYFAAGSTATLDSTSITGIVKYTSDSNVSVFGGLRAQKLSADATVRLPSPPPAPALNYTGSGESDWGFGYVIGGAYEIPEIALRAALTYNSAIEQDLVTNEVSNFLGGPNPSVTEVDSPQSVNLEVQSGIAEDTLLFGSIRWVEWTEFDISPADYGVITSGGSLVRYNDDRVTYSLGVGRRLNENFSVAATVGYEAQAGGFASNLGPTDGFSSVSVGGTYTKGNMTVTGGVSYRFVGDAQTTLDSVNAASNFTGNSAVGVGFKVGFAI